MRVRAFIQGSRGRDADTGGPGSPGGWGAAGAGPAGLTRLSPQGACRSHLVLEEPASIVQLDYSQKVLLVSTLQRSLLFHTEERSVRQVGAQPRKR